MSIEYNNTKDKWIKDSGITSENELINEIKKYAGDNRYFLAYCTDRFYAGRAELEQFNQLNKDNVLEIRLFSETEEILFIRSTVGTDFQWRIASEDKLDKSGFVERFPELSLFYRLFSPLDSEMICIFPYFCPYAESAREIREIFS